jgi:hypothetical protein
MPAAVEIEHETAAVGRGGNDRDGRNGIIILLL